MSELGIDWGMNSTSESASEWMNEWVSEWVSEYYWIQRMPLRLIILTTIHLHLIICTIFIWILSVTLSWARRNDLYLFLWTSCCAEERIVSAGVDVTGRDVAMVACIRVCYDWNLLFSPAHSSPCCCAASSCSRRSRIGITFLVPSPRTLGTPWRMTRGCLVGMHE